MNISTVNGSPRALQHQKHLRIERNDDATRSTTSSSCFSFPSSVEFRLGSEATADEIELLVSRFTAEVESAMKSSSHPSTDDGMGDEQGQAQLCLDTVEEIANRIIASLDEEENMGIGYEINEGQHTGKDNRSVLERQCSENTIVTVDLQKACHSSSLSCRGHYSSEFGSLREFFGTEGAEKADVSVASDRSSSTLSIVLPVGIANNISNSERDVLTNGDGALHSSLSYFYNDRIESQESQLLRQGHYSLDMCSFDDGVSDDESDDESIGVVDEDFETDLPSMKVDRKTFSFPPSFKKPSTNSLETEKQPTRRKDTIKRQATARSISKPPTTKSISNRGKSFKFEKPLPRGTSSRTFQFFI